jgi:hypothetical protein
VKKTRVAPILPVSDLAAALAHYHGLGFGAHEWPGGGYEFLRFNGVEIHLEEVPDLDARTHRRAAAYLIVEDAGALARTWLAAGADVGSRGTPNGVSTRARSPIGTAT